MKSKRILALMLALVMALSLAACGGSKQEETPADNAGNGGDAHRSPGRFPYRDVMATRICGSI